ncbi:unnamed protein product [Rhizophagus irregularis]|nr:unnamed protein product [Rhizophagus irregularis]
MPNNKASGPSKISYEMLKHLTSDALEFSLLLANSCFSCGDIHVYFIPKPHDFDAQLKILGLLLYWKPFANVLLRHDPSDDQELWIVS